MDVIEIKRNPDSVLPTVNPGRAYSFVLLDGTVVTVELAWTGKDGVRAQETVVTESISAHGAVLRVKAHLPVTTEVVLTHHKTRQSTKARIVRTDSSNGDKIQLIAVELDVPSETFWGITF